MGPISRNWRFGAWGLAGKLHGQMLQGQGYASILSGNWSSTRAVGTSLTVPRATYLVEITVWYLFRTLQLWYLAGEHVSKGVCTDR